MAIFICIIALAIQFCVPSITHRTEYAWLLFQVIYWHKALCGIRNSWERNIQGFPHFFIPKLQFTTSCISAHIHITVFQLVSLQSVCSPLLNTITTYLVRFTFICQRAECITCLPVKSTILSTASQPSYGYSSSKVRWSKGYCIHNTLRCGSCW